MTRPSEIVAAVEKNLRGNLQHVVLAYLSRSGYVRPDPRELAIHLHRRATGIVPQITVDCWTCAPVGSNDWDPRAGDWCYDLARSIIDDIP